MLQRRTVGFDTDLHVGDRVALRWRKSTSQMPRLLFRPDQSYIRDSGSDDPGNPLRQIEVGFCATASEVLDTLREEGLGWESSIGTYSSMRQGLVAEAELWVHEVFAKYPKGETPLDKDDPVWEAKLAVFRKQSPGDDLAAMGQMLAKQWLDASQEDVPIFREMIYDSAIEPTSGFISNVMRTAEAQGVDQYMVGRAAETFTLLYRDAPMLAWPLLLCVLLQHLPSDTSVFYDLTDHARESEVSSLDAAKQYLEDYWTSSTESLASQAAVLGSLFGALASFDSKVGRNFWFSRATEALNRLDSINATQGSLSTKARGDALEVLVDSILRTEEPELGVIERNYRTQEEEIDLVLTNGLTHTFWTSQSSALIFVECKNWKSPVGVKELRVFESKMRDRGAICKIGIFVSMNGFTQPALARIKVSQRDLGVIFPVWGEDLRSFVVDRERLTDWLRTTGAVRALGKPSETS